MFGMGSCDELRGYLDVKVPSAARKRGLLIQWKAWRKQWLVVRRFLVSSDPTLVNGERTAILGRRLEVRLTGDSSPSSISAPCPVVVVEEWQEDALVCPTQSRSHPFAFGLFPQPGCEPIIFLSGRSAEESRKWLASIRSLLVPPFRPVLYRLSSYSNNSSDDADVTPQQGSPSSSSPEICKNSCLSTKYPHICFPPLPPLPSRCRFRRRSSVESLEVPSTLMDRRRSLSDSEITASGSVEHHHRHRKCQRSIIALDPESSKTEPSLSEDYDHQHIYAGIADSGVCSSMSNDSRSYLSSSSSSSCSSSSGLYVYATASDSGFKSYLRLNSNDYPVNGLNLNESSENKEEEPSTFGGKVASSLITAGIGLMLSTPVPLEGVPDLTCLHSSGKEGDKGGKGEEPCHDGQEVDIDRRESIASGIYEEIQGDYLLMNPSNLEDESQGLDEYQVNKIRQSPPPLPPRSPSQFIPLYNGKQRNLAWLLGVHRSSNSCPASDDEDDDGSRESSPSGFQGRTRLRKLQRKVSEPFGIQPNPDDSVITPGVNSRRKNLESFLGVLEFGSRSKEMCKPGVNILNKSLGALDVNGKVKGEKDSPERTQNYHSRGRTYTVSAGTKNNFFVYKETKRCNSSDSMFNGCGSSTNTSPKEVFVKNRDVPFVVIDKDEAMRDSKTSSQDKENTTMRTESPECRHESERCPHKKAAVSASPTSIEFTKMDENLMSMNPDSMERCSSVSSDKSFHSDKTDISERASQSPKSPISLTKRLPWMKPGNALMRLLSKEPNKQQDSPSLKDRTRQAINRSLETLSRLSFSPVQPDDFNDGDNLTVGGSNFYRSATCTGVDMQTDRNNALRRGTGAIQIDGDRYCRSYESSSLGRLVNSDRYSRSYETTTLGRRKVRKKPPTNTVNDDIWVRETDNRYSEQFEEFMENARLIKDSAICDYHKSCLQESGEVSGHTLEDIERLAKQEIICERFCTSKDSDEPDYIPMKPLIKESEEPNKSLLSSDQVEYVGRTYKRVSVVPEEDLYMSMDGGSLSNQGTPQESYNEKDSTLRRENSSSHLMLPNDGDIYMPMEGRKSALEELAQR